ncbi:MAG: PKD domain-containing protein, partial [Nocardioidaceae bacterium]
TQDHPVVGSPYGTNFFRIEGPAGSFTGSTQLCKDPALGDDPTSLTDCIQSNDFAVQGKIATRMGVQATNAYYADSGTGHLMDLFAKSEPGQTIVVKGTGISQTRMREDAKVPGRYYARVFADGAPPADLSLTNTTDAPDTVDHIDLSMFGDKVHIGSSVYSNDNRTLTVSAQSGDSTAALKLDGFPNATPTVTAGTTSWSIPGLEVPPADVIVTSDKGGVDTDDVVITGAEDPSVGVVAAITGDANTVQIGQTVTLDGLSSTGTITGYDWSVSPTGAALFPVATDGSSVTFRANVAGTFTVKLTVTGKNNTDTATYPIEVLSGSAEPVANAGPDQVGVVPTSTVTLDGTGSKFASSFSWAQDPDDPVKASLKNSLTANPTFVVPPSSTPVDFHFTLTIKDVNGTTATDSVLVTSDPGAVNVTSAFYKRGDLQWRVGGTAKYCSANNLISVYWNKPVSGGGTTPVLVGSTSPVSALGVCSWEFRVKRVGSALRPSTAGTITVKSAYGGEALNVPFDFL